MSKKQSTAIAKIKYDSRQLIHAWANNLIKDFLTSTDKKFSCNKSQLYRDTELIAIKHKGFVFIKDFYTTYRYNIHSRTVVTAFNNSKFKVVLCHEVPDVNNLSAKWLQDFFIFRYNGEMDKVAYLRDVVKNKKATAFSTWNYPNFCDKLHTITPVVYEDTKIVIGESPNPVPFGIILSLKKLFGKEFTKFAKTTFHYNCWYKKYNGWSERNATVYKDQLAVNFWNIMRDVPPSGIHFISTEVKEEIDFRIWRYEKIKFADRMYYSYETCKKAYGTEDQFKLEQNVARIKDEHYNNLKRQRLEKQAEKLAKDFQNIVEWRKNPSYNFRPTTAYPILAINYPNEEHVITTLGVSIPIEQAKKAFQIFKRCKYLDKPFERSPGMYPNNIGGYKIISIQPEKYMGYKVENSIITLQTKTDWVMTIGCHKIPYEEVEEFLKFNKLDWNDTITIEQ